MGKQGRKARESVVQGCKPGTTVATDFNLLLSRRLQAPVAISDVLRVEILLPSCLEAPADWSFFQAP
jgi:hypothetical protein